MLSNFMECPTCGHNCSLGAAACPNCGEPFSTNLPNLCCKTILTLLVVFVAISVIVPLRLFKRYFPETYELLRLQKRKQDLRKIYQSVINCWEMLTIMAKKKVPDINWDFGGGA